MTNLEKLIETLKQIPPKQLARFLKVQTERPCEICAYWWHCAKGGEVSCITGISKFIEKALFESEVKIK